MKCTTCGQTGFVTLIELANHIMGNNDKLHSRVGMKRWASRKLSEYHHLASATNPDSGKINHNVECAKAYIKARIIKGEPDSICPYCGKPEPICSLCHKPIGKQDQQFLGFLPPRVRRKKNE